MPGCAKAHLQQSRILKFFQRGERRGKGKGGGTAWREGKETMGGSSPQTKIFHYTTATF